MTKSGSVRAVPSEQQNNPHANALKLVLVDPDCQVLHFLFAAPLLLFASKSLFS